MNKDKIKNTILIIVISLVINAVSVYANNYLFNSNEVSYNNNATGIQSDNVQGAIDKLYEKATEYTDIKEELDGLVDKFYPVGCYFETTDTTFNPNTVFEGTTWVKESEGLVHISSGTNYAVSNNDKDGGEATHTLTAAEMPSHGHVTRWWNNAGTLGNAKGWTNYGATQTEMTYGMRPPNGTWMNGKFSAAQGGLGDQIGATDASGGSQAHNNMQPYKIVNR